MQDLRLPRKGPTAETIVCLGDRVIRIPSAAKPRDLNSQISTLNSFFSLTYYIYHARIHSSHTK